MSQSRHTRPPRTFGLALALGASVLIYTLLPLVQVAMVVLPQMAFSAMELPLADDGGGVGSLAAGGEIEGIGSEILLLQAGMALAFLVIAVLAWRGRPPWIRFALVAAILLLLAINLASALGVALAQPTLLETGLDSGQSLRRVLASSQVVVTVLVSLYVIWYVNRAPARAFYRGYYLDDPQ